MRLLVLLAVLVTATPAYAEDLGAPTWAPWFDVWFHPTWFAIFILVFNLLEKFYRGNETKRTVLSASFGITVALLMHYMYGGILTLTGSLTLGTAAVLVAVKKGYLKSISPNIFVLKKTKKAEDKKKPEESPDKSNRPPPGQPPHPKGGAELTPCPKCGVPTPGKKFCGKCGGPKGDPVSPKPAPPARKSIRNRII